jgi:hypothetical protein
MTTSTSEPLAPFEERLLAELKQELTARPPALRPVKTGLPRPRRVAVAAAAVGLGAAAAAGLTVATRTAPAGSSAPRYQLAADFLNRAAAAARAQNDPLPRPNQVSYVEQVIVTPGPHGGTRECTVLWSPSPLTGLNGGVGGNCGPGVPPMPSILEQLRSPLHPSYGYPALNTLPTSPAALRAALYAAAAKGGAAWGVPSVHSTDVIVALMVGRLLNVPLSGQLRAGLYEVLAQMPGVTLVPNAVDPLGRHGTGIVMKWNFPGYGLGTTELIFAPGSYQVLGGGDVMPGQSVSAAIIGQGLVTLPKS